MKPEVEDAISRNAQLLVRAEEHHWAAISVEVSDLRSLITALRETDGAAQKMLDDLTALCTAWTTGDPRALSMEAARIFQPTIAKGKNHD